MAVPLDTIRQRPADYRLCLIEIRGTVTGHARREDGATLIVDAPGLGTYLVEAGGDPAAQSVEAGQSVRVLARVPDGSIVNRLGLVAVVSEYDAANFDVRNARKAAATKAATAKPTRSRPARQSMASRGAATTRGASILQQYTEAVLYFNRRLAPAEAARIARSILVYSNRYGLDARLVMAVVAVESNFQTGAVSRVGAMGLGQLMPGTASDLGVSDPWNPEQNLEGATRLLSGHLSRMAATKPTEEAIRLALACYNAGAGAVKRHKGIPPYRETKNYVKKVTRLYYQMCGQPVP
jgi:soluble lytic murein transglycosylase-like protein